MYQMDNEKFGAFIGELRREKHLTQKELAEKLFISDKAVSKWERGLSVPNVSMLIPLAEILGVTVTELLRGERLEAASSLNRDEVEKLVTCSVDMSLKEQGTQRRLRKRWTGVYVLTLCIAAAELLVFRGLGFTWGDMADSVLLAYRPGVTCGAEAVVNALYGETPITGKTPFQIPRTMEQVLKQREDLPMDIEDPLFEYGFGIEVESFGA